MKWKAKRFEGPYHVAVVEVEHFLSELPDEAARQAKIYVAPTRPGPNGGNYPHDDTYVLWPEVNSNE